MYKIKKILTLNQLSNYILWCKYCDPNIHHRIIITLSIQFSFLSNQTTVVNWFDISLLCSQNEVGIVFFFFCFKILLSSNLRLVCASSQKWLNGLKPNFAQKINKLLPYEDVHKYFGISNMAVLKF